MTEITKEDVGKRMLITNIWWGRCTIEAIIKEITPSGRYVKLKWLSGVITWEEVIDWKVVEILPLDNNQSNLNRL